MTYTLKSARYANEDHSSAIVDTEEDGLVAFSAVDTPGWWEHLHQSGLPITPHEGPSVEALRRSAMAELERNAQRAIARVVTPGMDQVYMMKKFEALECLDDPDPKKERYRLLAASIGVDTPVTGDEFTDLKNIATLVVDRANQCGEMLAHIETLRRWGKRAYEACQTRVEVDAVKDQIRWPA